MRLVYKIILTFMIPLILTLGVWGWFSYRTMADKINKDTDMILKDYSDDIISRLLNGRELPERFNGAYNTYYIEDVSPEYAATHPGVYYGEAEAFLKSQEEFASSRIRRQIFLDGEGRWRQITVSLPTFEQETLVEHVLWWTILLFFCLMIAVLVIGLLVLNYNMRPLNVLLKWIDEYEPGNFSSPCPSDTDIIEFRKLADAVNDAVYRFEHEYEERKIFIGNASHELQTPLAACSNRIEIMLDRTDLNADVAEELVKLHRSLQHLIRLNKTLLLLSKIENGQFPDVTDVDFSQLVADAVELNEEVYSHKSLDVDVKENGRFVCSINEQMASVLVNNLVKNAFVYTVPGEKLKITIEADGFTIANSGETPLDRNGLFRRFYQPSGRREGSTGLGLALAHSVCVRNGLEISYDFSEKMHIFSIKLKN